MRPFIPALTGSTLAALILLLACAAAAPARAQDSGPGGGEIIENTIFEHVVVEEIAEVTERAWGQVTLDGAQVAEQPADGETPAQFAARIGAASCAETLVDTAVDSQLVDTTSETVTEVSFEVSEDAEIIGDLADWPNIIVAQGTLTVTNTTTTIETQHITETTTETYDLTCLSAQSGGQTIENFVIAHVVDEEITESTERAWRTVTIDGATIADQPADDETAAQFAARVGAAACTETLVDTAVNRHLDDTTFDQTSSVEFDLSDDAEIIGDLNDWPDVVVAQGTLIVTTTETTIETQHITETTTETYDLACTAAPPKPTPDEPTPAATGGSATSLPNAGTGAAAPGEDNHAALLLTLLLPLGALAYHRRCRPA